MLRALIFAIKIGLIVAAAFWVAQRPGEVELNWLGYHVTAQIGIVLLFLFIGILFILAVHRILLGLAGLPKAWRKRQAVKRHEKGYRALTQGLTAVAAGDAKQASDKAAQTRSAWPDDKGLSLLLEAQAARLRGEEEAARETFDRMLGNKDTAFLGLRGLLVNALERGDNSRSLELARKAKGMHPRQPWINQMVYDLELEAKDWPQAERTLTKAVKLGAVEHKQAQRDRIAMLAAQADEKQASGDISEAIKLLRKAHKIDAGFVPVAERLATLYLDKNNKRSAKNVVEAAWKKNPHPDLVPLWDRMVPAGRRRDVSARMHWFEKLVALKPDSVEGQLAAAEVAMDDALWGQARQYLDMAEQIAPSARLYRLYAQLSEKQGESEAARRWLEKAAEAPAEKVWTCRETGRIYESWSPVAAPHGSFNTIVWDYPSARHALAVRSMLPQNELLITAK